MYENMFIAAIFIFKKREKKKIFPGRIIKNKMYTHKMEYYTAMQMTEQQLIQ